MSSPMPFSFILEQLPFSKFSTTVVSKDLYNWQIKNRFSKYRLHHMKVMLFYIKDYQILVNSCGSNGFSSFVIGHQPGQLAFFTASACLACVQYLKKQTHSALISRLVLKMNATSAKGFPFLSFLWSDSHFDLDSDFFLELHLC